MTHALVEAFVSAVGPLSPAGPAEDPFDPVPLAGASLGRHGSSSVVRPMVA